MYPRKGVCTPRTVCIDSIRVFGGCAVTVNTVFHVVPYPASVRDTHCVLHND